MLKMPVIRSFPQKCIYFNVLPYETMDIFINVFCCVCFASVTHIVVSPGLQSVPGQTQCPLCQQTVITKTEPTPGLMTWLLCAGIGFIGYKANRQEQKQSKQKKMCKLEWCVFFFQGLAVLFYPILCWILQWHHPSLSKLQQSHLRLQANVKVSWLPCSDRNNNDWFLSVPCFTFLPQFNILMWASFSFYLCYL